MVKTQTQEVVSYEVGDVLVVLGWNIEVFEIDVEMVVLRMSPLNKQLNGLTRGDLLFIRRKKDEIIPFSGMRVGEVNREKGYVIFVPIFQTR